METILRVKRHRDEEPVEFIAINKKPKKIENLFDNLSISEPIVFKRIPKNSNIEKINTEVIINDIKSNVFQNHVNRSRENRLQIANKWRNKVLQPEDTIYCNGEALISYKIANESMENCVIDEYCLYEANDSVKATGIVNWIYSDTESEDEFAQDSEDSNREDNPWNDYPDEESSETSKSVASGEYENEVQSDNEYY